MTTLATSWETEQSDEGSCEEQETTPAKSPRAPSETGQSDHGSYHVYLGLKSHAFDSARCAQVVSDVKKKVPSIRMLEGRRANASLVGDYDVADQVRNALKKVYKQECNRRQIELTQQYNEDIERHAQEYKETMHNFQEDAIREMEEFDERVAESLMKQKESHEARHDDYLAKLRVETKPVAPRWSPELLRLRKTAEVLAKQREYAEAKNIRTQAQKLEELERTEWEEKRERKIQTLEAHFLEKLKNETVSQKRRIHSLRQELLLKQEKDRSALELQCTNMKQRARSLHKVALGRAQRESANVAMGRSLK